MKTCTKCRAEKSGGDFYRIKATGQLASWCKRCRIESVAAYVAANKAKADAYGREWREKNRTKLRAQGRARYVANREATLAANKAWRLANPEKWRAQETAWRARHRERWREIQAVSAAKEPKEKKQAREKAWREANPGKKLAARHHYRAREKGAKGSHTAAEWRDLLASYHGLCVYCGAKATTRDHLVPLVAGGANTIENIVPACRRCNFSKHKRPLLVWLALRRRAA